VDVAGASIPPGGGVNRRVDCLGDPGGIDCMDDCEFDDPGRDECDKLVLPGCLLPFDFLFFHDFQTNGRYARESMMIIPPLDAPHMINGVFTIISPSGGSGHLNIGVVSRTWFCN
jgi:hypothetical protein